MHQHSTVAHVLAIGTEVVASENAVEFPDQDLDQDLGAPPGRDLEHREERGTEAPSPHSLAEVIVAGLVQIQKRLIGERAQQQFVGLPFNASSLTLAMSFGQDGRD